MDVTPFAIDSKDQFRPEDPPALDSAEYTAAFNEVKELGSAASATRTADQTDIALFWANGAGTATPIGHLNLMAQVVAIEQGEPDVERMRAEYDRRRRLVVDGFNAMGLETFEPLGAFYAFPRVTSTGLDSEAFARRLLEEERVAVVPGSAFGPSGEGHVRACYATAYEDLEEALRRIARFVERCRLARASSPS